MSINLFLPFDFTVTKAFFLMFQKMQNHKKKKKNCSLRYFQNTFSMHSERNQPSLKILGTQSHALFDNLNCLEFTDLFKPYAAIIQSPMRFYSMSEL